jgi:hypothetical protein
MELPALLLSFLLVSSLVWTASAFALLYLFDLEDFSHARGGTDSTRNMTRLAPAFKEIRKNRGV